VNYIEVLPKVDFPCRVHLRTYLLLDFTKSENGPIVHFWWLVLILAIPGATPARFSIVLKHTYSDSAVKTL
jgi:hypothetical protein